MVAAMKGKMDVFKLVVGKGANVSLTDTEHGNNILHAACKGGDMDMVKYIVSHVMENLNVTNKHLQTPANVAKSQSKTDILSFCQHFLSDL